ncbi:MAG: VWA domain-containing protein [Candidatus Gracilibacteria bacterium]|nr:VWA domain-containing protein [Candidatus Gracilibacteria bacterium]MDD5179425.1 VWA domain-containing protein [Candidatus Gracilibacteria bacterium]
MRFQKSSALAVILLVTLFVGGCGNATETTPEKKIARGVNEVMQNKAASEDEDAADTEDSDSEEVITTGEAGVNSTDSCDASFQKLVDKYGKEYGDCYGNVDDSYACSEKQKITNLILVLDGSGSMGAKVQDESKMEIAKAAASNFVGSLKSEVNFGFIIYGQKGSTAQKAISCAGIDTIATLGKVNATATKAEIAKLRPVGWTPIADSLRKAQTLLEKYPADKYRNIILLISDGEETCDGDPVATAKALQASGSKTVTNVIGFDVGGEAEAQLKNIASNGSGAYYSARTANELNSALVNLTKVTCASQPNAWSKGFSSVLDNFLECNQRLGDEKHEIQMAIGLDEIGNPKCKAAIKAKYDERYQSIYTQIKAAEAAGNAKLKNISPNSDDAFFNPATTKEVDDETMEDETLDISDTDTEDWE